MWLGLVVGPIRTSTGNLSAPSDVIDPLMLNVLTAVGVLAFLMGFLLPYDPPPPPSCCLLLQQETTSCTQQAHGGPAVRALPAGLGTPRFLWSAVSTLRPVGPVSGVPKRRGSVLLSLHGHLRTALRICHFKSCFYKHESQTLLRIKHFSWVLYQRVSSLICICWK